MLVDIEVKVDEVFIVCYGLSVGYLLVIEDDVVEVLYQELVCNNFIIYQFVGGIIGNIMYNYLVLVDDCLVLFGVMCSNIEIGGYVYCYLCNIFSCIDLNYLQGVDGVIGCCFILIGDSGECIFVISLGYMNKLCLESILEVVIVGVLVLVLIFYLVCCKLGELMLDVMMKVIEYVKKYDVLVVLIFGIKYVIVDNLVWWQEFLQEYVFILVMNEEEGEVLIGFVDLLLVVNKVLDWVDLVLCIVGLVGLYMVGFIEEEVKCKIQYLLLLGVILEFNQFEFSCVMCYQDCVNLLCIYFYIVFYMGGFEKIMNINGVGDGVLVVLLYDIIVNNYYCNNVFNFSKYKCKWLIYFLLVQVCKYVNCVSYQVLNQYLLCLICGLLECEDSLEEVYWDW